MFEPPGRTSKGDPAPRPPGGGPAERAVGRPAVARRLRRDARRRREGFLTAGALVTPRRPGSVPGRGWRRRDHAHEAARDGRGMSRGLRARLSTRILLSRTASATRSVTNRSAGPSPTVKVARHLRCRGPSLHVGVGDGPDGPTCPTITCSSSLAAPGRVPRRSSSRLRASQPGGGARRKAELGPHRLEPPLVVGLPPLGREGGDDGQAASAER